VRIPNDTQVILIKYPDDTTVILRRSSCKADKDTKCVSAPTRILNAFRLLQGAALVSIAFALLECVQEICLRGGEV
jgi:hypothetical protein